MAQTAQKKIYLRPAREKDSRKLLLWRNDPITRQNSFSSQRISAKAHQIWFLRILESDSHLLLMAVCSNRSVGVVRYDLLSPRKAEVNINIAPKERGKGLGAKILVLGSGWRKKKASVQKIMAKIKFNNSSSQRAFEQAGYRLIKRTRHFNLFQKNLYAS